MNETDSDSTPPGNRAILFIILLVCGFSVFMVSITFTSFIPGSIGIIARLGLCLIFLGLALCFRQSDKLKKYWQLLFSFFIAACALLFSWLLSDLPGEWFNLKLDTPQGLAVAKLSESALIVIAIVVLTLISGGSLASIYLKKGRLRYGLTFGIVSFIILGILSVLQSAGQGIPLAALLVWAPWILVFVLSNGFMEELLFRGVFLRKYEAFFSPRVSNLLAAIIFAVVHMQVTYTPDLPVFLMITFLLALAWGWLMQKTDSIWGSALFHAGADLLIIVGIFASYGI
jgi:membrane protease YdiL (CAAX protease family)